PHYGDAAVDGDVGAHAPQFIHVFEAAGVDGLRHDAGPQCPGEHRDHLRLHISRKAGIGLGADVERLQHPVAEHPQGLPVHLDAGAGLHQLCSDDLHVLDDDGAEGDVAAADCGADRQRPGLDAVGDHRVVHAAQGTGDAADPDGVGAGPPHPAAHAVDEVLHFDDLRLPGGVADHRLAVGYRCGHHQVLGRPDAGQVQVNFGALQLRGPPVDVAVPLVNDGPQRSQAGEVQVDGPGADGAAAGLGDLHFAQPPQQRAHHLDGRPHAADGVPGCFGMEVPRFDVQYVPVQLAAGAQPFQDLDHVEHVADVGHVADDARLPGEQGRSHELEHRVLGPAHPDVAPQLPAPL